MTAPDRRHTASSVAQIALLFGLPASLPGGAWTSSFPGRPRSEWSLARLLVRRVVSAPVAKLAQLDAIRRVSPGLICLIVAPLAVFASQRHRNADISASHVYPSITYAPLQGKPPGRGTRLNRRIALGERRRRPPPKVCNTQELEREAVALGPQNSPSASLLLFTIWLMIHSEHSRTRSGGESSNASLSVRRPSVKPAAISASRSPRSPST